MTLIEILMALVILTGALLGMGRFITGFSHATSDGTLTSTASDLVLDRLEYVKATKPYPNLSTYAVTEASIPGFPSFARVTQVSRTNTAQFDYTAITVTVSHPSLLGAGQEDHDHRRLLKERSHAFPPTLTSRAGVTLIELMIAIVLFVMVFGLAVPFFRFQARSVSESSGRQDALQNARFAQNAIDRDLRMAGAGVVAQQPLLVQATMFARDLQRRPRQRRLDGPGGDLLRSLREPRRLHSMTPADKVTLPLSAVAYPDSNYFANSLPSGAETISFWVSVDSTSGRSDEYILFRRVNSQPPRVVAKGILIPAGQPFFTYYRTVAGGTLDSIPSAKLPLYHSAPIHGASDDTARLRAHRLDPRRSHQRLGGVPRPQQGRRDPEGPELHPAHQRRHGAVAHVRQRPAPGVRRYRHPG